jgi:hypothetical protein
MKYQTEILRFKEGARSRPPSPEATVAAAQPNVLSDAGRQIAVLVDLTPHLPYRSREIRSLVVKTYWTSSGSIVARLRRALAAANRHLISFNHRAPSGNKCAGSITCAVFSDGELFLGQVGAAYAYVSHPPSLHQTHPGDPSFEIFPRRDRLLIPLGGTVPPVIHIGYTIMVPGSVACIATTRIAETMAREMWQQTLALAKLGPIATELSRTFASRKISGSAILLSAEASPVSRPAPWAQPRPSRGTRPTILQQPTTRAASLTPIPPARRQSPERIQGTPEVTLSPQTATTPAGVPTSVDVAKTSVTLTSQSATTPHSTPPSQKPAARQVHRVLDTETAVPQHAPRAPRLNFSLDPLRNWFTDVGENRRQRREARKTGITERFTTAERARLRHALRTLLPGKVDSQKAPELRTPPPERKSVMAGLALGFLIVVCLITLTKVLQLGGPLRAEELLAEAEVMREQAYDSQESDDWYTLLNAATQIVRLDPQNPDAVALQLEAQQAIDALENASMLSVTPLLELGTAPRPRRILIADSWAYVLNTATDAVMAYPLSEDGRTSTAESPTTILRRGQTYLGEVVNHLVDFAWITPCANHPDGAIFIYSDGGSIFIYEPDLGPGSISVQHIDGDLAPGNITLMETFGEKFYLVHRQLNQILMYEPVNGVYRSARAYFADGASPDLQLALDIAIDGRVYLLMGDGSIQSYFSGSYDPSFEMSGLPDTDFTPLVMDIGPDVDDGLIYLAETQKERIIVLDKRGEFVRQYRLPRGELQRIESLTVAQETQVLYLIAENRLYAAPLPSFEAQPAEQP